MKRPTLEEVKEYFKDAETVECTNDSDAYYLDWSQDLEFYSDSVRILHQKDEPYSGVRTYCQLWSEDKGYAKILTYKNNDMKYEITKEQILELAEWGNSVDKLKIRGWFPDAFKTELIVGKWYKSTLSNCLANIQELFNKDFKAYGFDDLGVWVELKSDWTNNHNNWTEATESEIFEALRDEAVRRGFVEGVWIKIEGINDFIHKGCHSSFSGGFVYHKGKNILECDRGNGRIFDNGKWAE